MHVKLLSRQRTKMKHTKKNNVEGEIELVILAANSLIILN